MARSSTLEKQCIGNLRIMEDGSVIEHFPRLLEAWDDTVRKLTKREPTQMTLRAVGEFLHKHQQGLVQDSLLFLLRKLQRDTRDTFKKILQKVEGPPATVTYVRSLADKL